MSNQVFVEVAQRIINRVLSNSYIITITDAYASGYVEVEWEKVPDSDTEIFNEIIAFCNDNADTPINQILEGMEENQRGATICGTYYDFEELDIRGKTIDMILD